MKKVADRKLVRQYHKLTGSPGKYKIIGRYMSWHGSTLGSLSASGLKSRKTVNEPLAPGFLHVFPPTCYPIILSGHLLLGSHSSEPTGDRPS